MGVSERGMAYFEFIWTADFTILPVTAFEVPEPR